VLGRRRQPGPVLVQEDIDTILRWMFDMLAEVTRIRKLLEEEDDDGEAVPADD
jgi:hypothetical protein